MIRYITDEILKGWEEDMRFTIEEAEEQSLIAGEVLRLCQPSRSSSKKSESDRRFTVTGSDKDSDSEMEINSPGEYQNEDTAEQPSYCAGTQSLQDHMISTANKDAKKEIAAASNDVITSLVKMFTDEDNVAKTEKIEAWKGNFDKLCLSLEISKRRIESLREDLAVLHSMGLYRQI